MEVLYSKYGLILDTFLETDLYWSLCFDIRNNIDLNLRSKIYSLILRQLEGPLNIDLRS